MGMEYSNDFRVLYFFLNIDLPPYFMYSTYSSEPSFRCTSPYFIQWSYNTFFQSDLNSKKKLFFVHCNVLNLEYKYYFIFDFIMSLKYFASGHTGIYGRFLCSTDAVTFYVNLGKCNNKPESYAP